MKPFPFQYQLRDYFKNQSKTWAWFLDKNVQKEQIESFKTDLLKNAYRIDPASEPQWYELLEKAKAKLNLSLVVTLYQSQQVDYNNGAIVSFDNEAHLILSGSILKLLSADELLALFGHELSHIHLNSIENGDFEVTNRIITAIANDYKSELFYHETARIFQLFTELYCDLGALKVTENLETVVTTLVKIETGLEKVSAESYLKQADEILARIEAGSSGESHPEIYIRAKSLELLATFNEENIVKVEQIVKGKLDLQLLTLFGKKEVYGITKHLVDLFTKPKWMQSEQNIVLYQQYFAQYNPNRELLIDSDFKAKINNSKDNLKNYYAYVLFDFAVCDSELKEIAIGHALDISEQLEIDSFLKTIIKKELRLTEKSFRDFCKNCTVALNQILESESESSY
ncbi:M48 family metalloprotease [Flavobacterium sp.]